METIAIYHNPRCSKSREALELIRNHGFNPVVIEYLKTPLDIEQLRALRAHFTLEEFIRTNEPVFKELQLSLKNEDQVLQALVKEPALMQRPIIAFKGKAIIGRPPEKVMEFLSS
ncbi:arsenate reductase (glutaredoxin) [Legionella waltersii]|uniref:Arsenate reductase n=1 Tax=Legionella waltersii TaxID=66969 RepID=A0A0W1A062_9GAMM|nr:arsenate reductase (glutaredoxin) [Legionella waltersii]KTD74733.1 oxidoreductase [Legionella waltersii]SNV00142.1 oxidoreductase [Legionella waltersii]